MIAMVLSGGLIAQQNKPLNDDPNLRSVHGTVYDASDMVVKGAVVQLENT